MFLVLVIWLISGSPDPTLPAVAWLPLSWWWTAVVVHVVLFVLTSGYYHEHTN